MRLIFLSLLLMIPSAGKAAANSPETEGSEKGVFTFFQLNLWHECAKVPGAFEALADQIAELQPDIASFCELSHGNDDPEAILPRLVSELAGRGLLYYHETGSGRGVISRYPLSDPSDINGSVFRVTAQIDGRQVVVYSAHLYYRYYSSFLPRGYMDGGEGGWDKLDSPIIDPEIIVERSIRSGRAEHIGGMIRDAAIESAAGKAIILAGDFNEPSHLDWTEATKDLWDHNGCVIEWPVSGALYKGGYRDAFREMYPDPVAVPGFTFPAANKDAAVKDLTWAPEADERERIDFIYYRPMAGLSVKSVSAVGPGASVKRSEIVTDPDHELILTPPGGRWSSDHKGLFATFSLD